VLPVRIKRYWSKVPFACALKAAPWVSPYPAAGESGAEANVDVPIIALVVQIEGREPGVVMIVPVAATKRQK
jgi:hypothetical protein